MGRIFLIPYIQLYPYYWNGKSSSHVWNHRPQDTSTLPNGSSTWVVRAGDFGTLLLRVSSTKWRRFTPWPALCFFKGHEMVSDVDEMNDEMMLSRNRKSRSPVYLPVIRMEHVSDQSYDISLSDLVIFYRKTSRQKPWKKNNGKIFSFLDDQVFWRNHRLLQFGDISNLLGPAASAEKVKRSIYFQQQNWGVFHLRYTVYDKN